MNKLLLCAYSLICIASVSAETQAGRVYVPGNYNPVIITMNAPMPNTNYVAIVYGNKDDFSGNSVSYVGTVISTTKFSIQYPTKSGLLLPQTASWIATSMTQ